MKVYRKSKGKLLPRFGEIRAGIVFIFDDRFFMKMALCGPNSGSNTVVPNAVELDTGDQHFFAEDVIVEPIHGQFVES